MNNYRVEMIHLSGPKTDAQIAGSLAHSINDMQKRLGDRWELISVATSPYSSIMTTWKSKANSVKIENLRTGNDWMMHFGHQIIDLDGWRSSTDNVDFMDTEITLDEYRRRYNMCTVNSQRGKHPF